MKIRTGWLVWLVLVMAMALAPTEAQATANRASTAAASADEHAAQVVVLCTLHQLHEEVPGYSYADLSAAIEQLHPDVLALELTPAELAGRVSQKIKREYQNAVYPLLAHHKWTAVAMEPEGALRTKLIAAIRQAEELFEHDSPQKAEVFQTYSDTLFSYLRSNWHSPADVNSAWTDDLFAVKHAFQEKLLGPKEVEGWEGWNQYFLQRILVAAKANPGKRIVVIVGAEHGYWLREHLHNECAVKLLDTARLLRTERGS